jgi:hypothetical protein
MVRGIARAGVGGEGGGGLYIPLHCQTRSGWGVMSIRLSMCPIETLAPVK